MRYERDIRVITISIKESAFSENLIDPAHQLQSLSHRDECKRPKYHKRVARKRWRTGSFGGDAHLKKQAAGFSARAFEM